MALQQKIRLPIASTDADPSRIIDEIHCSIFYSFEASGTMMLSIKHSILPPNSRRMAECSWRFTCLKLVPIVCVWDKKSKMCIYMHVDNDRCIMDNVVMQVLEIFLAVSQAFYSFNKLLLFFVMQFLTFFLHVYHCLVLERSTAIES